MVKRRVDWKIFIVIGIVTFIFFFSGLFTGIIISRMKTDTLSDQVEQFRTSLSETETMMLFLSLYGKDACGMLDEQLNELAEESEDIGKDVAFYETTKKVEDPAYIILKKNYMSVMLKHWLYQEKANMDCGMNSTTILFFYSNLYCEICKDEGIVLTYLKQKYPDKIMIFSFDVDMGVKMIDFLGEKYDFEVRESPVLIIDNEKYEGFLSKNDIKEILCNIDTVC